MTTPDNTTSAGDPLPAHLDPAYQAQAQTLRPTTGGLAPGDTQEPDTTGGQPAVPLDPGDRFGQGAGVDLAPVSQAMANVRDAARDGDLFLDEEQADDLLRSLTEIRDQVQRLEADANEVAVPLRFGDNWVGHAMSDRLRGVADGAGDDRHSALKVIQQFRMVVDDYERAVRHATCCYRATEDELASEMSAAAHTVDDIGGERA